MEMKKATPDNAGEAGIYARVDGLRERVEHGRLEACMRFESALDNLRQVRAARQLHTMDVPMIAVFPNATALLIADARAKALNKSSQATSAA